MMKTSKRGRGKRGGPRKPILRADFDSIAAAVLPPPPELGFRLDDLPPRERALADELIRGRCQRDIAHWMGVSVDTVSKRVGELREYVHALQVASGYFISQRERDELARTRALKVVVGAGSRPARVSSAPSPDPQIGPRNT
jgi:DNA-binding NarL/FixJ family response regulator